MQNREHNDGVLDLTTNDTSPATLRKEKDGTNANLMTILAYGTAMTAQYNHLDKRHKVLNHCIICGKIIGDLYFKCGGHKCLNPPKPFKPIIETLSKKKLKKLQGKKKSNRGKNRRKKS